MKYRFIGFTLDKQSREFRVSDVIEIEDNGPVFDALARLVAIVSGPQTGFDGVQFEAGYRAPIGEGNVLKLGSWFICADRWHDEQGVERNPVPELCPTCQQRD